MEGDRENERDIYMRFRPIACLVLSCLLFVAACERRGDPTLPLAPSVGSRAPSPVPSPPSPSSATNWRASATVLATVGDGPACGWGVSVGDTRADVGWQVTVSGNAVSLDEDTRNWPTDDIPYAGTLSGLAFTAAYTQGPDYLNYACQFKGGTLAGTFNADFTLFEAHERLTWGPPEAETTVERHWTGSRF